MLKTIIKKLLCVFTLFLSNFMFLGFAFNLNNQIEFDGIIEHLAFTTLMAFPEKALDSKNNNHAIFDQTKITPFEFKKILENLHSNNYILVDINDTFFLENSTPKKKTLFLPKNKKPIILSFDNVSYKSSYQNLGTIDKIIIDRNNEFATYTTKKSIQDRINQDNEFIPILESFISLHPDFSLNSARGIIFCTGENGLLGYKTNTKNSRAKTEIKRVFEIVSKLKSLGWKFGCNSYRYTDINSLTNIELAKDINLWNKEIQPLVNPTPLFAYPHGIRSSNKEHDQILAENNFNVLFYNSMEPKFEIFNNSILATRKAVNGNTLRNNSKDFEHLFNCKDVYDHTNRTIPFDTLSL